MGLAVLTLPTLLIALDIGVLFLVLPHLSADLGASATQQLWIMDIYGFMLAGFLVTMGTLGDRIGRRRLLIGGAAFGLASGIALSAMTLGSAALVGTSLLTSQYVQSVVGLAPAQTGLWLAPTGLGIAAGVLLVPFITQKINPATAIVAGLALSATGLLLLSQVGSTGGLITLVLAIAVVSFGVGPLFALGTGMVVGSVPPEKAGAAASLSETSNELGATLGLAIFGSVGAAVYHYQMADAIPSGVPTMAAETARETVAAATAIAGQLPAPLGSKLLDAASEAFTSGLNVVAAIGAVIFIALAMLTAITLRDKGAASEAADAHHVAERANPTASDRHPEGIRA
jgi:DHA2 family multidrug resistance protein-like MFS transporter